MVYFLFLFSPEHINEKMIKEKESIDIYVHKHKKESCTDENDYRKNKQTTTNIIMTTI